MSTFRFVKKGYDPKEVNSYISKLKKDYEERLALQKNRIFALKEELEKANPSQGTKLVQSLVVAVENAKQIESSSKSIYELEAKKLSLIYAKMEKLISEESVSNVRGMLLKLIQDCRFSLQSTIDEKTKNLSQIEANDPIKKLLDKMMGREKPTVPPLAQQSAVGIRFKDIKLTPASSADQKDLIVEQTSQVKVSALPRSNEFAKKSEGTYGEDDGNLQVEAFDFREALNPKEDLNEIMKAFDFFNDKKSGEGA